LAAQNHRQQHLSLAKAQNMDIDSLVGSKEYKSPRRLKGTSGARAQPQAATVLVVPPDSRRRPHLAASPRFAAEAPPVNTTTARAAKATDNEPEPAVHPDTFATMPRDVSITEIQNQMTSSSHQPGK
jgi:hypothetical protein